MNEYMLDYSGPERHRRPDTLPPNRGISRRSIWQILLVLGGWVGGMSTMGMWQLRSRTQEDEQLYQTQAIRYDSLLAAKLEADQRLEQLRRHMQKP